MFTRNLPQNDSSANQEEENNQSFIHNTPLNNLPQNPFYHFPLATREFEVVQT